MPVICGSCGEENPERARFCLGCAAPLGADRPHEERKLATVVFADLVGSTAMAHDQDPERTRLTLDRFYDAMTVEVERCGGTVEKFAGDAVMAAFGAPAALEDHAERALHAGLAMRRRLAELFGETLALRVGVNTGEVVVGRPRVGSSFVTGDAVNVAARLEQAAEPGQILAGERTVTAARGAFEFGDPQAIEGKGKPDGVPARPVLRALSLMRPRGVRGLQSVFLGREAQLDELTERYRQVVANGEAHLVSILGDAGVGKSRLVRELWGRLSAQSPEPHWRTGRTLSYGQGTTYWPMGEVLKEHFGISESETPEAISARLADHPYLGLTLGLAPVDDLHPLVARERLHDAWVEFLEKLVGDRPAVLLIEDVHWAEDDLCDLIDTLVAQVSGPLLVLATARPEMLDRRPAWGGAWHRTSAMRLEPLQPPDAGRLLEELLGADAPRAVRDLVIERSEGNPFFLEELVGTLIDRGVLVRSSGTWTFGELPAGFTVPDSIQAVLAARIDLLPAAEKSALQAASVIGRTFWTGPVYELIAGQTPDMGLLEERDFVRRRPGSTLVGEREYVIKHALTREVAYASLPKARRARLHADFAGWLEGRVEGREELASLVAHHYAESIRPEDRDLVWTAEQEEEAFLRERAVTWLRRAADLAVRRYEIADGLEALRRAVALEQDPARQADLWYEIGHASALRYDGEGFVVAMERALELGAPEAKVYPELAYQTVQRMGMWQRRLDDRLMEGWIERAVEVAADGTPARVRALVASAVWHDDLAAARTAQTMADDLADVELRSDALGALQTVLEDSAQFGLAREAAEARTRLLPSIADPDHVAEAQMIAVELYLNLGRIAEAREAASRLEQTVSGLTPHHRVHGIGTRILLEAAVGNWEVVRGWIMQAEGAVEANLATPCPFNVGMLLVTALAQLHDGDGATAGRLMSKAESIGMVGYGRTHAPKWLRLAIARHDRGEIRRVLDSIDPSWLTPAAWERWAAVLDGLAALDDRERIEALAPQWLDQQAYVAPFARRALGIARRDRQLLAESVARFEAMGLEWHAQETRTALRHLG